MQKYRLIIVLVVLVAMLSGASLASAAPGLQGGGNVHVVSPGETLFSIAMRYGVTVEAMMQQNGLINPNIIYVGQPLVVPGYGHPGGGYGPPMHAGYGCPNFHVVTAGDTLSSIAYHYGVGLRDLLSLNRLYNQDIVYVGQKICLPGYTPQPVGNVGYGPPPSQGYYHTVAAGESVYGIASQYGVNQAEIMRVNRLPYSGLIFSGQQLTIPGYGPAPKPAYHETYAPPPPPVSHDHHGGYGESYKAPPAPGPAPSYRPKHDAPIPGPAVPEHKGSSSAPPPPAYESGAPRPLLPQAEHPIVVKVNAGETWVGEVNEYFIEGDDRTILIVKNEEDDDSPEILIQSGDYEVKGAFGINPEFGHGWPTFAFPYVPDGDYDVSLIDPNYTSQRVPVTVNPGKRVEVKFRLGNDFQGPTYASPDGWVLADWYNPSQGPGSNIGGWSNIMVKAPASGLWIMIESEGGGYSAKCFTGTKGPGMCDLAGLSAGMYYLWIDGTDLVVQTYMDGDAYAEFTFDRQPLITGAGAEADKVGPVRYKPEISSEDDEYPSIENMPELIRGN